MAKIEKIGSFKVTSDKTYFFDNNVWMLIYAGIANSRKTEQQKYSSLLRDIQSSRATIVINSMIISEYINRSLRLGFDKWKLKSGLPQPDFKSDYRKTEDYKSTKEVTISEIKQILKLCLLVPDNINALNLDKILNCQNMDFNDAYIAACCEHDNWILVTDDTDLINSNFPITIVTR